MHKVWREHRKCWTTKEGASMRRRHGKGIHKVWNEHMMCSNTRKVQVHEHGKGNP